MKMSAIAEMVFSVPSLGRPKSWMKLSVCLSAWLLSKDMACGIRFSSICSGQSTSLLAQDLTRVLLRPANSICVSKDKS